MRMAQPSDAALIANFNCQMAMETESLSLNPSTVLKGVEAVFKESGKLGFYLVATSKSAEEEEEKETTMEQVIGCLMVTFEWVNP